MYAECSKKEVESKPLVAASVGAGVVWSGVGTFMVARAGGEQGMGIVRSPILMLWGPLWSPAAGSRIITHQQTSARERATIKPLPLYLLYQLAARGPLA